MVTPPENVLDADDRVSEPLVDVSLKDRELAPTSAVAKVTVWPAASIFHCWLPAVEKRPE
jgi:hypothetical protein